MRYFKQLDNNGELSMLLTYSMDPVITNPLVTEISEDEYSTLKAEIEAQLEAENPTEETGEPATEADYIAALQEVGVEV